MRGGTQVITKRILPWSARVAALVSAAVLGSALAPSRAGAVEPTAEWPGWRGAGGSGVAAGTQLPTAWSASENVTWKIDLPGRGVSSPVVAAGRVYVTCASGYKEKRLHVVCLDAASGSTRWHRQIWATGTTQCHPKTSMAAPTPVTDGGIVAALFASWDAAAFDLDGTLLWCRSLARDFPALSNQVGAAASPVLHARIFVCALETDAEARVVGIDSRRGETRWSVVRPAGINWTTPLIFGAETPEPLVLLQSSRGLSAVTLAGGIERWSVEAKLDPIASPTAGAGLIFAPGASTMALRPKPSGSGASSAAPDVVWQSAKVRASTASPLFYEGRLYAVGSSGVLTCADAGTGDVIWQERLKGAFSASPVAADGKLCFINEDGEAAIVDTRAEPRRVGTGAIGESVLASPAVAGGGLFIRTERRIYRVDGKGANASH